MLHNQKCTVPDTPIFRWIHFGRMSLRFNFEDSLISICIFSNLDLQNTRFYNCQVKSCDFAKTNLKNVNFEDSDLEDSIFENTNLSFASFKNAKNYRIDPNQNLLKKTKFSIPEVISLLKVYDIEIV